MEYKKEYKCSVLSREMLLGDTAYIELNCPDIARTARPGQFVNVSCSRFLKRPFGIASVDRDSGSFFIGVKSIGSGTGEIITLDRGDEVDVLGPLGNGFDLDSFGSYILVSGGTGVFPVNFAAQYLESSGKNFTVVQGFGDASQVVLNRPSYVLTTDSGDCGIKGTAIAGLDTLDKCVCGSSSCIICVGPVPMMKAVSGWALNHSMKCYVSMEQRMACGVGICLCCIVKVKADNKDGFVNVRCCKDGPVFDSSEVIW